MTTSKILIAVTWAVSLIQSARPAFDVASIRPSRTSGAWFWDVTPGGRVVWRNCTLKRMILLAYRLQEYQVVGDPAWVSNDGFDVEAKPDSGANPTNEQSRQMLQSLFEQRFHLQVEIEDKSGPMYAIVTVKNALHVPPISPHRSKRHRQIQMVRCHEVRCG